MDNDFCIINHDVIKILADIFEALSSHKIKTSSVAPIPVWGLREDGILLGKQFEYIIDNVLI